MWTAYTNWLSSLNQSWFGFTLLYLGGLGIFSLVAFLAVQWVEAIYVKRGSLPQHSALVSRFFLSAELFFLFCALYFVPHLTTMPRVPAHYVRAFARAGMIFALAAIALKAIDLICASYLRNLQLQKADNLRERKIATKLRYVEKLADILICLIAIALVLMGFDEFRRVGGSLLASAGLASLILGLAAQKSIGTWIAGLQVAFTQPIRIGDAVLVENEWGEIEEINLTYVVIKVWDLRRLVVPITYFLEKPFQNWTRNSADLIGVVYFLLDYTVPVARIREEHAKILKASSLWDGRVNSVQVTDSFERTVQIRTLASARSSGAAFDLRCEIREKMLLFIQKEFPECLPKVRFDEIGEAQAKTRDLPMGPPLELKARVGSGN